MSLYRRKVLVFLSLKIIIVFIFCTISGYILGDTNATMAGWKVYLDINNNGTLEENEEPFVVTDNTGYYEFQDIEKGEYTVRQITHQNWDTVQPLDGFYHLYINQGQIFQGIDFENTKLKGKGKNK